MEEKNNTVLIQFDEDGMNEILHLVKMFSLTDTPWSNDLMAEALFLGLDQLLEKSRFPPKSGPVKIEPANFQYAVVTELEELPGEPAIAALFADKGEAIRYIRALEKVSWAEIYSAIDLYWVGDGAFRRLDPGTQWSVIGL